MSTISARKLGSIRYLERRELFEIRLRERPGGNQVSSYIPGPDTPERRLAAERHLAERISKLGSGRRRVERTVTVGAWLDRWIGMQADARPATLAAYEQRARLYVKPTLGHIKLADLEPEHVAEAFEHIARMPGARVERLSVASVAGVHRMLAASLEDAYRMGRIERNPCRLARVKRPSTRIEPPTLEELDRVFAELRRIHELPHRHPTGGRPREAGGAWLAYFETLRWTGARRGEILGLTWRDVRLDTGEIRIARGVGGAELKTRSSARTLLIPEHVAYEIGRLPRRIHSPYVFTTSAGAPLDTRNIQRRWDEALERAGVAPDEHADLDKYRLHDMRHAFATLLLEAGIPSAIVSSILGHSSLAMLDRYSHVRPVPGGEAYRRLEHELPELIDVYVAHHRRFVPSLVPSSPSASSVAERPRA